MSMLVFPQEVLEEWTEGSQDDLVGLNLLAILTCQSDISEVKTFPQASKCCVDIFLVVVPLQTKLLRHDCCLVGCKLTLELVQLGPDGKTIEVSGIH